jgi:hypothetical protein
VKLLLFFYLQLKLLLFPEIKEISIKTIWCSFVKQIFNSNGIEEPLMRVLQNRISNHNIWSSKTCYLIKRKIPWLNVTPMGLQRTTALQIQVLTLCLLKILGVRGIIVKISALNKFHLRPEQLIYPFPVLLF